MTSGLQKAVHKAGSQGKLASALSKELRRKIYQSHVQGWLASWKGVPAEYCAAIEKVTGISRKKLRPDIYA